MRRRRDMQLPDVFKLLLGKDPDQWPEKARLIAAGYDGDVRRLKEMAKSMDKEGKGIRVTLTNTNFVGTYPLHAAWDSGCLPVLQYLVEDLNMDVNKSDTMRGYTPVEHAVGHGRLPALRFLLDHGADLHHMCEGVTLRHAAVEKGQSEITKSLLSRGARVDVE